MGTSCLLIAMFCLTGTRAYFFRCRPQEISFDRSVVLICESDFANDAEALQSTVCKATYASTETHRLKLMDKKRISVNEA